MASRLNKATLDTRATTNQLLCMTCPSILVRPSCVSRALCNVQLVSKFVLDPASTAQNAMWHGDGEDEIIRAKSCLRNIAEGCALPRSWDAFGRGSCPTVPNANLLPLKENS